MLLLDVDGVLTDGTVLRGADGTEARRFSVIDGHGLGMLRDDGMIVGVVSREDSAITRARMEKLRMPEIHVGANDKAVVVADIRARHGLGEGPSPSSATISQTLPPSKKRTCASLQPTLILPSRRPRTWCCAVAAAKKPCGNWPKSSVQPRDEGPWPASCPDCRGEVALSHDLFEAEPVVFGVDFPGLPRLHDVGARSPTEAAGLCIPHLTGGDVEGAVLSNTIRNVLPARAVLRVVIQRRGRSVLSEGPLEHVIFDHRKQAVEMARFHLLQGRVEVGGPGQRRRGLHEHHGRGLLPDWMML